MLALIASLKTSAQEQYQVLGRYNRITEAEKRIKELDEMVGSRNRAIAEYTVKIDELDNTIFQLRNTIDNMLKSTSWRLSAPLRWARSLFSK